MVLINLKLGRQPWSNSTAQLLAAPQPPQSFEVLEDAESKLFGLNVQHAGKLPGGVKMCSDNITATNRKTLSPARTQPSLNKTGRASKCFVSSELTFVSKL